MQNRYKKFIQKLYAKQNDSLVQKMYAYKKFSNMWSMTLGAMLSSEASEQACIREVSIKLVIILNLMR